MLWRLLNKQRKRLAELEKEMAEREGWY